jgi:hypothetical protein
MAIKNLMVIFFNASPMYIIKDKLNDRLLIPLYSILEKQMEIQIEDKHFFKLFNFLDIHLNDNLFDLP